jgi:tetratricopeptide (TPR) repeat protein
MSTLPTLLANRQIRIFISSTFSDMMRERDLLVKQVFPALRRICAKRFVTFTEVDLRWGITEEQAAEGKVLPLCLAEIERSRPYFIGLLGERYGWIPDAIPAEVVEKEPWLKEHLNGRKSVTELEILHGVLNSPEMQGHSFFYFRDPAYVNDPKFTEEERREMLERDIPAEVEKFGPDEAARRTEERKGKLAALKQQIRDSKLPLVEPYEYPEALARIIEEQFGRLIDYLYPETDVPDELDRERLAHEAHAKNKLFACIDRPVHLAALTAFAESPEHDGRGLVVTGESGGGKTALLAAWARGWATSHPDDFLFQHYFGATPDSSSPDGFLHRLLGELKSRFGITEEIPSQPDKLREALPLWLAQTVNKGRIILILDGLNQVQGDEPDKRLNFLPRYFPPHVVVIVSALPGPALDALRERHWTVHELPLADEGEVNAMVSAYLGIHARNLDEKLRQELITAPGTKNPLFLRTVLEELRQFGSFEKLPDQVRHYLEAENPKELFLRVIRRLQTDFDGKNPKKEKERIDLVRRGLTHLWAAREGLSESEWLDLLGTKSNSDGDADSSSLHPSPFTFLPLPRAHWTPLFLALEPHLSQRSGLFAFGHDFIRQAVETAFLSVPEDRKAAHIAVADFFGSQEEMTPRKAAEWPWQLHAAEAWYRLEACLTDIPLFLALCDDKTQWELTGYWHPLRVIGRDLGVSYTDAYRQWIESPANAADHLAPHQLGYFLMANGLYAPAEPLLRRALEARERALGPEHPYTLKSMNNLGVLLVRKGDNAGAQPLLELALEAEERILGSVHPDTLASMKNLASLLQSKGDYSGAQPLLELALEAEERILGPEHPDTLLSVNGLAVLLVMKGDYAGAQPLLDRTLEARERVLGAEHPDTLLSVNNMAHLLASKGDYEGAQPLRKRAMGVLERVLGPEHPFTLISVNGLASLLLFKGDYAGAQPLLERTLEASERVLGPEHPDTLTSVNNLAMLLYRKGDYAGAQPLFERALEVRERVLGPEHPDTLASLGNLANLLERTGCANEASQLRLRRVELLAAKPDIPQLTLRELALDCLKLGEYVKANELLNRLLQTGFEVLSTRLHLARICLLTNNIADAKQHVAEALAYRTKATPYVIARILWMQVLIALLDNADATYILGQLKSVLQSDGVHMEWTMQPVLDHLQSRLSAADHALLTALVAALSDKEKVADLDQFAMWRKAEPKNSE